MACNGCGGDYYVGDSVDVEIVFQDAATGASIDMDTVVTYITPPTGSSALVSTAHPSLGTYTATFAATAVGQWRVVQTGTINGKSRVVVTPIKVLATPIVP